MKDNPAIKTFLSATILLLVMLFLTGLLTYLIPNGTFNQETMEFTELKTRGIGLVDWIFAPFLVLTSDSGSLVIAIILFLLIIGGSINVLKETGLVEGVIVYIARRFAKNEFLLLCLITFLFMSLGAMIGVFEEVVPLVPLMIILAAKMGWDDLTGLGVSLLAAGLGFTAAITNPFTIGVSQQLAGLPLFSGTGFRVLVFLSVYVILVAYLYWHIKRHRVERLESDLDLDKTIPKKAYIFFIVLMSGMALTLTMMPFVEILRELSIALVALAFLIAAIGVGVLSGNGWKWVFRSFWIGIRDLSPAILLVLMATGIKYIMDNGNILDTILYWVANNIELFSPVGALIMVFFVVTLLDFFIGSGSAKAFVLMPILMPIMDILGVGRQLGILAYQFGDGYSDIMYPTNAVLLISLGLAKISFGKWFRYIFPLLILLFALSIGWMAIGYWFGYGL